MCTLQQTPIFVLIIILGGVFGYQQNDYNLTSERMEVAEYDPAWVIPKLANFKYNRTHSGINLTCTVKKDLGRDLEFELQAYKFASNEYRLFPVNFKTGVCDVIEKNDFGLQNIFNCGNFTGCPIGKGDFRICNWQPDGSKFPPHAPAGRFMLEVKVRHDSKQIVVAQWYFMIEKRFFFN